MSNASIAQRLLSVVARVQRGELSITQLEIAVEAAVGAFEGIPGEIISRLRDLPAEAISQDVSPIEAELLGLEHSDAALRELHALLHGITAVQQQVQGSTSPPSAEPRP